MVTNEGAEIRKATASAQRAHHSRSAGAQHPRALRRRWRSVPARRARRVEELDAPHNRDGHAQSFRLYGTRGGVPVIVSVQGGIREGTYANPAERP